MKERVLTVERLTENLIALARALGFHRPHETRRGEPIAMTEMHALMDLSRGEMSQSELARRLRLQKSTVSRLVQQLHKRGWIARDKAGQDRRVVSVRLTTRGKNAIQDLFEVRHAKFNQLLALISREKHAPVVDALSILVRGLESSAKNPTERTVRGRVRAAGRFIPH